MVARTTKSQMFSAPPSPRDIRMLTAKIRLGWDAEQYRLRSRVARRLQQRLFHVQAA